MNWYNGNIAEAVAQSKAKNAIFVVYIEGKDESTQKLTKFINEQKIRMKLESDDFVAIKIESDSEAYMQFATIYQVVPVPSIFFIGKSGTPLEIGTGVIESAEELEEKIDKVLAASGKSTPASVSATSSFIAAEQQSAGAAAANVVPAATTSLSQESSAKGDVEKEGEIVCEGDVCYKKPKTEKAAESNESAKAEEATVSNTTATEVTKATANVTATATVTGTVENADGAAARLEETRKVLEQKRRERVEMEKKREKEREVRRRKEGQDVQSLQQSQKELELKELKENRRRERMEEQAIRDRIRSQIAGDRAERAHKFGADVTNPSPDAANVTPSSAQQQQNVKPNSNLDLARLQFRFPNGKNATNAFNCQDTLATVRTYVRTELLPGSGIKHFILATTYPKREFAEEHDSHTLVDLGLFPSAVILIISKESNSSPSAIIARSGGLFNILTTVFWAMLSPVFAVFDYFKNWRNGRGGTQESAAAVGAQKRANEERGAQHEASKRRNLDRFMGGGSSVGTAPTTPTDGTLADAGNNEQKPYRRYGGDTNIHRLTDNRKDSDDENATWNGNSTQQQ